MKQRKGQDLFTFTLEIHRLLNNRLMSDFEVQLMRENPGGYHEIKSGNLKPWTEGAWQDLCGKMGKLFARLYHAGLASASEAFTLQQAADHWRNSELPKLTENGEWNDLQALLCRLEGDLRYYSDRWGYWRYFRTCRIWNRILELKAAGHELRSFPKNYVP